MSRTEASRYETIGLDVGTSRIVTARQTENDIHYETQLNAFVGIPYSKMTAAVLTKEGVPHAIEGDQIIVHGNESGRFADLLSKDVRRTMQHGILNPDEPESVRLIKEIVTLLTGKGSKGQRLYYSVPAAPLGAEEELTYHDVT